MELPLSGLLDLLARDYGAILALVGIGGGEDFRHFLLRLLGLFVALVFAFGHGGVPYAGVPQRRMPGGSLPALGAGV